ncbi:uncharacterized protein LOC134663203 [Cydia amplana]|uniref:uncharacterized protein LOC134663203 n=1 Tax=Cydia amplana TaxID=1869771 RepID=UPI002FE5A67B
MNTLSAKFKDFFLNLKTDAVPRPPRNRPVDQETRPEENNENYDPNNEEEPEVIVIEEPDDDLKKEKNKKSKPNKDFSKEETKGGKPYKQEKRKSDCTVNTQATGHVINIVNSKDVRWGDDYYMGSAKPPSNKTVDPEEEGVEKCNLITLLMESKQKPILHEYLDQISGNLGKNWYGLFISLGFLKGKIETMEINTRDYGVTEARYKLLLDWTNNDDDGTLGGLTQKLWDHGDRALVKQLAIMYNKNK